MKHGKVTLGLVLAISAIGGASQAQFVAIDMPISANGGSPLNGNRGNFSQQIGKDFRVINSISVLSLGAFDSAQNGFTAGTTITVSIYKYTGASAGGYAGGSDANASTVPGGDATLVTQATFTNSSAGTLGTNTPFRFKTISGGPLILSAGYYEIVADGFNASNPFFDGNPSNSTVNFSSGQGIDFLRPDNTTVTANRYGTGAVGTFAPISNGSLTNYYVGGTFTFIASTPEPGAVSLVGGLMLAGTGFLARRRRLRN